MASCLALPRVQRYSQRRHANCHDRSMATKLRRERRAESSILVFMAVSVSADFDERLLMPSFLPFVCGSAGQCPHPARRWSWSIVRILEFRLAALVKGPAALDAVRMYYRTPVLFHHDRAGLLDGLA